MAESRLAEVERITRDYAVEEAAGPVLPRDELLEQVQGDEVFLLDVRPALEYQHGHLPGAVSLPIDQLSIRLDELPRDRRIVTYCRGSFCLFADEAVAILRRHGFDAYRLEGGWPEWWAEERPISG